MLSANTSSQPVPIYTNLLFFFILPFAIYLSFLKNASFRSLFGVPDIRTLSANTSNWSVPIPTLTYSFLILPFSIYLFFSKISLSDNFLEFPIPGRCQPICPTDQCQFLHSHQMWKGYNEWWSYDSSGWISKAFQILLLVVITQTVYFLNQVGKIKIDEMDF